MPADYTFKFQMDSLATWYFTYASGFRMIHRVIGARFRPSAPSRTSDTAYEQEQGVHMASQTATADGTAVITETDFDRLRHLLESPRYRATQPVLLRSLKDELDRAKV